MGELKEELHTEKSVEALKEIIVLTVDDQYNLNAKSISSKGLSSAFEASVLHENQDSESTSVAYHWINSFGYGPYEHKRMVLPLLGIFCNGLEILLAGLLNYDLSRKKQWDLDKDNFSQLASSVFVGMMIGSIVFGILSDKFGRRPVFIAVSFLLFASSLSTAFSNSFAMLVGMRALTGFFMGGQLPISITMAREICPDKNWAMVNSIMLAFFAGGSFYCAFVAYLCMDSLGWRYFVAFCAIPTAIQSIITLFYPETVRYHEVRGDVHAVRETLLKVAKENNASRDQYDLVRQDCQMAQVDYDNGELVFVHERSFLDKCTEIRHLFNASNIRVTIVLAIGGWLICNLNIYSLNFYVNGILEIYEFASSNIYKATMINAFATIIGYFAAFFSVRFIGYCATIALRLMLIAGFAIGFGLSSTDQAIIITCWFFECFLFLVFGTFYSLTPPTYRSHFGTNTVGVCEATTRAVGICFPYIFNALLTSHKDSIIIPSSLVAGVDILVALLVMLIVFKTRDQKRFTEV